jgi:hypothetical protein
MHNADDDKARALQPRAQAPEAEGEPPTRLGDQDVLTVSRSAAAQRSCTTKACRDSLSLASTRPALDADGPGEDL